jgi:hypothetical protein
MLIGSLELQENFLMSGASLGIHNIVVECNTLVLIYASYEPLVNSTLANDVFAYVYILACTGNFSDLPYSPLYLGLPNESVIT